MSKDNNWLEVNLPVGNSGEGRACCRRLRRLGARHVWQRETSVLAILPDTPACRAALAGLGPAEPPRPFAAQNPLHIWHSPRPEPLGPGLALAPAWSVPRGRPGLLVIDPLTAFGSGDHPSTRLNLELLAAILAGEMGSPPPPGAWAADVGTGTGILALCMALAGGLRVAAVDPDPASRRAVARNRELNAPAGELVHFVSGTHAVLGADFPLVAANLPGPLLLALAGGLARRVAPGGGLVVSGFRVELGPEVEAAFMKEGLAPAAVRKRHGWEARMFRRP